MKKQNLKRLMSCLLLLSNITFALGLTRSEAVTAFTHAKNVAPEKVWAGLGTSYYRESQFQTLASEANQLYTIMRAELEKAEAEKQLLINRINDLESEVAALKQQQKQVQNTQVQTMNNDVKLPEEEKDDGDDDQAPVQSQKRKKKTTDVSDLISDNIVQLLLGFMVLFLLYQKFVRQK